MSELSPELGGKIQIIASMLPYLRSRSSTVRRSAFDNALSHYQDVLRAENELLQIIDMCKEIERA